MVTPAVRLTSVGKVYGYGPSAMIALNDVDLVVEPGRFVSLIGPSGCGKSTLLRIVAGLETAGRGEVRVHDVTPGEAGAAKLIGLVPQTPALLPWLTVLQNVTLPQKINPGAAKRRQRIGDLAERGGGAQAPDMLELLDRAGLADAAHKLPAQLSGGMQQRAAIVRAFGLQPDVLLMDEPFSALDEFTRESLQDQLLDLWDELKTTVLFVTHSVSEAVRMSDTVVVMAPRPGRIVDVIDIDLPRPRNQKLFEERRFHEYEDLIRDRLHSAWRSTDAA
ncbi:ABC transporter ATP-binding protein [Leifsonia sp. C5G2]|uniref:ABC transporter ATP-binding protein n=1 Tax=Leifsonia sp. C5G2 TaxID=2735269 RepID=UPI00158488C5|nr:ABC transporter ATP-binding protein [Leifsonia sp. C5G2]NUU06203.1 ABC transporter ATP-binding protein [Leifsonia sp. C5G2]